MTSLAIQHIGELVTWEQERPIRHDAAVVLSDGVVAWVGDSADVPAADSGFDAGGRATNLGRYHDRYRRDDDNRWRYSRREIVFRGQAPAGVELVVALAVDGRQGRLGRFLPGLELREAPLGPGKELEAGRQRQEG